MLEFIVGGSSGTLLHYQYAVQPNLARVFERVYPSGDPPPPLSSSLLGTVSKLYSSFVGTPTKPTGPPPADSVLAVRCVCVAVCVCLCVGLCMRVCVCA